MEAFARDDLPVVIDLPGLEIRAKEVGGMALMFYRFGKNSSALKKLLSGLPNDMCTCPHWAYVIKGRLRIDTLEGAHEVAAGQAFYVQPGHVPEALEDTEMVEVSPVNEIRAIGEHIMRQLALGSQPQGATA